MKKLLCCFFALSLFLTITTPAMAYSESSLSDSMKTELVKALEIVEQEKDKFKLADVNFSDICIGNPIYTYQYIDDAFIRSTDIFPLFDSGQLIALSLSTNDGYQQVVTSLTEEIRAIAPMHAALIYDAHGCYLYDGESFHLISTNPETVPERSTLPERPIIKDLDSIHLNSFAPSQSLRYSPSPSARAQTYYSLNVGFVYQEENRICWAACAAALVNYLQGESLTAVDIAKEYWYAKDEDNYNQGITAEEIEAVLSMRFKLKYKLRNSVISDNAILDNIQDGYPIYGILHNYSLQHACIIYGVNPVSGYITVMDPAFGYSTAYSSNNEYSYTDPNTDTTWILHKTVSRYTA